MLGNVQHTHFMLEQVFLVMFSCEILAHEFDVLVTAGNHPALCQARPERKQDKLFTADLLLLLGVRGWPSQRRCDHRCLNNALIRPSSKSLPLL
jgi:hypothetical protein